MIAVNSCGYALRSQSFQGENICRNRPYEDDFGPSGEGRDLTAGGPASILPGVKKRILLLAGGQSGEHEVSLMSARSVLAALPVDQFDVTPVVISKQGRWLPPTQTLQALESGVAASGGDPDAHARSG